MQITSSSTLKKPPQAMAEGRVIMEVGDDGVAVIFISNPPANILSIPIIAGMKDKFDEATKRDDVKAIVLTGKGGKFCGGLDLNILKKVQESGDISPDISADFTIKIEDCKKPVVAAMESYTFGGGLEIAMACHARIAAPKTQLSLPELKYGIIPGAGGTQRLPRLIGIPKAVEMLLMSTTITSEEGKELGLIDLVVPSQELIEVSRLWASDIAAMRKPCIRSLYRTDKLGSLHDAQEILKAAKDQARRTTPNMAHRQVCLDIVEEGIVHGGRHGLLNEEQALKELVLTDISKALLGRFFSQHGASQSQYTDKSARASSSMSKSRL